MGWRDELRPGSFRGIPLELADLSISGGKRLVVDEYPEQDEHTVDELGKKPRRFRVRALVAGDSYLDTRDRLLDALEQPGPGELVHPWRGRVQVYTGEVEVTHDGHGACEVTFECVLATTATSTTTVVDQAASTSSNADDARAAGAAQSAAASMDDLPTYYSEQVLEAYQAVADAWGLDLVGEAVEDVIGAITDLRTLVRMATEYPLGSPRLTLGPAPLTPTEEDAVASLDALFQYLRVTALAFACELAVATDYLTADAAAGDLASIVSAIESELADTSDATLFDALVALRASTVAAVTDLVNRLPRLRTYDAGAVAVPAIVLAFDLYEDVTRDAQIVSLNNIGVPTFCAGRLTVLSE